MSVLRASLADVGLRGIQTGLRSTVEDPEGTRCARSPLAVEMGCSSLFASIRIRSAENVYDKTCVSQL